MPPSISRTLGLDGTRKRFPRSRVTIAGASEFKSPNKQGSTRPYRAYTVIKREVKEDFWLNVGVAFRHEDRRRVQSCQQAGPPHLSRNRKEQEKVSSRAGSKNRIVALRRRTHRAVGGVRRLFLRPFGARLPRSCSALRPLRCNCGRGSMAPYYLSFGGPTSAAALPENRAVSSLPNASVNCSLSTPGVWDMPSSSSYPALKDLHRKLGAFIAQLRALVPDQQFFNFIVAETEPAEYRPVFADSRPHVLPLSLHSPALRHFRDASQEFQCLP